MERDIFDEFEDFLKEKDTNEKCDGCGDCCLLYLLISLFGNKTEQPIINIYLGSEEDV